MRRREQWRRKPHLSSCSQCFFFFFSCPTCVATHHLLRQGAPNDEVRMHRPLGGATYMSVASRRERESFKQARASTPLPRALPARLHQRPRTSTNMELCAPLTCEASPPYPCPPPYLLIHGTPVAPRPSAPGCVAGKASSRGRGRGVEPRLAGWWGRRGHGGLRSPPRPPGGPSGVGAIRVSLSLSLSLLIGLNSTQIQVRVCDKKPPPPTKKKE